MATPTPEAPLDMDLGKPETIITMREVSKNFSGEPAVDKISLTVPRGLIFGLIGPSGSGKTTTVRLLTGTYTPNAGEISVFGVAPSAFDERTRRTLGYMPQHFGLYDQLTVRENLSFVSSLYGLAPFRRKSVEELLDLVELSGHVSKRARALSGGMRRRLSLAASLIHDPQLIFLDEPTAGIDPVLRRKFWDYFDQLKQDGRTLFITTQYVDEAAHCDMVAILRQGRLLAQDTPQGLRELATAGGVLILTVKRPLTQEQIDSIRSVPDVVGVAGAPNDTQVRVSVKDPSTAIPPILARCSEMDVIVLGISPELPSMEDIFVQILADKEMES